MIRTQVYLTEDQVRDIKLRAKRENRHEAEVIRELLSEGMKKSASKAQESTGESLLRLAEIGGKGPADLSSRVDDYLYGENR
jgi:DNA polymerase/3'-5' exonuclease PolX